MLLTVLAQEAIRDKVTSSESLGAALRQVVFVRWTLEAATVPSSVPAEQAQTLIDCFLVYSGHKYSRLVIHVNVLSIHVTYTVMCPWVVLMCSYMSVGCTDVQLHVTCTVMYTGMQLHVTYTVSVQLHLTALFLLLLI
jgi:hypothetical protein